MTCDMAKWDERFLDLAELVAGWSKDPSTQCGAVITKGNRIVSLGYNGFPSRLSDDEVLYEHRSTKYERIIHAEMNAILYARGRTADTTLYTWPLMPCDRCAAHVVQAGIARVVSTSLRPERWANAHAAAMGMFHEAGVIVASYQWGVPPKS